MRERSDRSTRRRGVTPDRRVRRLSPAERRRVYQRRRVIAMLVALLLAVAVLLVVVYLPLGNNTGSLEPLAAPAAERDVSSLESGFSPLEAMDVEVSDTAEPPDVAAPVTKKEADKPPAPVESSEKPSGESQKPAGKPQEAAERPEEVAGEPLDVLVLGVDKRPEGSTVEGSRADTIMLARVFPDNGSVKMLSIPRDMFVEIEPGVEDRINAAYAYGGVPQMAATVERLTGVTVDRHAVVDFQGFEDIVNAVDGVTVEVKGEMPRGWHMEGRRTLDGRRALLYARYRGTPGGDLDRIARQQQVVNALRDEVISWNSLLKLPEIVRVTRANVETDSGIMENISLGRAVLQNGDGQLDALQLKGVPETTPDGRQVLMPDLEENERLVKDFKRPDSS